VAFDPQDRGEAVCSIAVVVDDEDLPDGRAPPGVVRPCYDKTCVI